MCDYRGVPYLRIGFLNRNTCLSGAAIKNRLYPFKNSRVPIYGIHTYRDRSTQCAKEECDVLLHTIAHAHGTMHAFIIHRHRNPHQNRMAGLSRPQERRGLRPRLARPPERAESSQPRLYQMRHPVTLNCSVHPVTHGSVYTIKNWRVLL